MNHRDPSASTSTIDPHGDAESRVGAAIELPLGRRVRLRDAGLALQLEAVVADTRAPSAPGVGACTVRLSLAPERGEVSAFYLTLDPEAPALATASAFGHRVTLLGVTSTPAADGLRPVATIVVAPSA